MPEPDAQEREIELRTGCLVGDQDVALAGARGARRDSTPINHADREPRAYEPIGARGTHDARADDDDVVRVTTGAIHCHGETLPGRAASGTPGHGSDDHQSAQLFDQSTGGAKI